VPGGQGFARRLANLFSPLEGRPYSARGSISTGLSRDRWPEEGTLPAFLCIGGGVVCLCLGVTLNRVFGGDQFALSVRGFSADQPGQLQADPPCPWAVLEKTTFTSPHDIRRS